MIFAPKPDGTCYVVEFRTADGEALAISIPRGEAAGDQALPEAHAALLRPANATRMLCARAQAPLFRAGSSENR
jgi:hypothetical protein